MDCSRLMSVVCLFPLLLCGCGDPGRQLRRAAHDGDVAAVEKILQAHPELVNDRDKTIPATTPVATKPPPAAIAWLNKFFGGDDEGYNPVFVAGLSPLDLAVKREREAVVKVLLAQKANPNATN